MSDPTPEAKRAVQMIMREFHHASEFVMEQHVQQALDAITDKSLKLFADALAEKDKVIEGLRLELKDANYKLFHSEAERTQAEKARDELVGLVKGKIQGKSLRDYLTEQFPATIGHVPLREHFDQLTTLLARIDAKGEKI